MNSTFLQFESSGAKIKSLSMVGTIDGVELLEAAAANGPGVGVLAATADGITWTAPGSAVPGPAIAAVLDADIVAADGENPDRWIRLRAIALPPVSSAEVFLSEAFNNALAGDDATAAAAAAGQVLTSTIGLHNVSTATVPAVKLVFVSGALRDGLGFECSLDGATWVHPTSISGGLAVGDVAAGGSVAIHLRRTVPAGISPQASLAVEIEAAWTSGGIDCTVAVGGRWRIFGPAAFRLYATRGMPPVGAVAGGGGSIPWRTAASLPAVVDAVLPPGTWFFAASYFNGLLDSGFLAHPDGAAYLTRVVGGTALPPPRPMLNFSLDRTADPGQSGHLTARGSYWEDGAYRAGSWVVQYALGGATTDLVGDLAAANLAIVAAAIPAGPGQTIRVRAAVRRNDSLDDSPVWVYSAWTAWLSLNIPAAPAAPRASDEFPGVLSP